MPNPPPLEYDVMYHIYNRGTNRTNLFAEERNYRYFLDKYLHCIEPVAETYAYCLLRNHFHLFIRVRSAEEQEAWAVARAPGAPFRLRKPSRQFANLFGGYAMGFNKTYGRTGSLFEHPFHRKQVQTTAYRLRLVVYIHRNPQHHGLVRDFREWPCSSYQALLSTSPTHVQRDTVLAWYGGVAGFVAAHKVVEDDLDVFELSD